MEQVPFMCDGIYLEKQKSTVPNFDHLESTVLLMAVNIWLGLVKLVGKKGTCSKNLPVCPKLAFAVTSIQYWFSLLQSPLLFSSSVTPSQTFVCLLKTSLLIS